MSKTPTRAYGGIAAEQRAEERQKEFAERERLKEIAAEEIRRLRLAESLNKKVVVLVKPTTEHFPIFKSIISQLPKTLMSSTTTFPKKNYQIIFQ